MRFKAHGKTYDFDVEKGQMRTRIRGEGWKWFIAQNGLTNGEKLYFP
jgi:hypothetical protein